MKLIDVNELKEWVENWFTMNKYYHPYSKSNNIPINELYDILEQTPTIDVESGECGEWIEDENTTRCSKCGNAPLSKIIFRGEKIWEISLKEEYHYCPNCGVRMVNK